MRPAVFLDRDGTLIEQVHYLRDPRHVRVLQGVCEALRLLHDAGYVCVVVSNQSAIGRGLMTEQDLDLVNAEMCRQLEVGGAQVDAHYHCPLAPRSADRTSVDHPDRKPGPGMLQRAARDLGLDLPRSWMVGDMKSDLLAGTNAGVRGSMLVLTGNGRSTADGVDRSYPIVEDLLAAARLIVGAAAMSPDCGQSERTVAP